MKHILKAEDFSLCIELVVFESDRETPINTLLRMEVQSNGYAANAVMDVDIGVLVAFANKLYQIYQSLRGEAKLEGPYGQGMYLSFTGNGRGHFAVKGRLCKENRDGLEQVLEFENDVDQTAMKPFCIELLQNYGRYSSR